MAQVTISAAQIAAPDRGWRFLPWTVPPDMIQREDFKVCFINISSCLGLKYFLRCYIYDMVFEIVRRWSFEERAKCAAKCSQSDFIGILKWICLSGPCGLVSNATNEYVCLDSVVWFKTLLMNMFWPCGLVKNATLTLGFIAKLASLTQREAEPVPDLALHLGP